MAVLALELRFFIILCLELSPRWEGLLGRPGDDTGEEVGDTMGETAATKEEEEEDDDDDDDDDDDEKNKSVFFVCDDKKEDDDLINEWEEDVKEEDGGKTTSPDRELMEKFRRVRRSEVVVDDTKAGSGGLLRPLFFLTGKRRIGEYDCGG